MTIKEVEKQTGLPRSVIRFYEKEGLIAPQRNEENRYRAYSQADVDRLVRIAFLRTLDIPLEEIRSIIEGRKTLRDAAQVQGQVLCEKSRALARAQRICAQLEEDAPEDFDALNVSRYADKPDAYVKAYRNILLQDCKRFALWFGGDDCFIALVMIGTLIGAILFPKLPQRIPIQWNTGEATGTAPRGMIFAYPLAMLFIRFVLSGRIRALCLLYLGFRGAFIAPYAVNGLCFLMLCLEAFTVLFLFGIVRSVEMVIVSAGVFTLAVIAFAAHGIGEKNKR